VTIIATFSTTINGTFQVDTDKMILSIEKNRLGPTNVEISQVLNGDHFVFEIKEKRLF
jgi:hypothetical protein